MGIINLGKINGQDFKAIVTLPGWQADKVWERGEGVSTTDLIKAYKASVWAYACITIRADAIAGVEWEIVPETDEDSPLQATHPAVQTLKEVNPEMNGNDLMRATESDLDIFGVAYWLKARGQATQRIKGLMRLNPSTIKLEADSEGIKGFTQRLPGRASADRTFPREDVMYFREYDPFNDLGGLSKLSVAMAAVNAGVNAAEYTAAFFKNYAIPPIVFSSDQSIDESTLDKIVAAWKRAFGKKENQHRAGFTTHGMKPNIIGYPTKDLALAEILAEVRRDVCAVFRVPPAIAGAWEAANFAASREQMKALIINAIKPRGEYLSGVIEAEYLDEFQPGLRFKWRWDKLEVMAEDQQIEAERHATLVREGIEDPQAAAEELEVKPAKEKPQREFPVFAQQPRPGPRQNGREDMMGEEMRQWERFAINRMKRGQVLRAFTTEHIPATLKKSIEGQLEAAKTAADVTEIMRAAEAWRGYP